MAHQTRRATRQELSKNQLDRIRQSRLNWQPSQGDATADPRGQNENVEQQRRSDRGHDQAHRDSERLFNRRTRVPKQIDGVLHVQKPRDAEGNKTVYSRSCRSPTSWVGAGQAKPLLPESDPEIQRKNRGSPKKDCEQTIGSLVSPTLCLNGSIVVFEPTHIPATVKTRLDAAESSFVKTRLLQTAVVAA